MTDEEQELPEYPPPTMDDVDITEAMVFAAAAAISFPEVGSQIIEEGTRVLAELTGVTVAHVRRSLQNDMQALQIHSEKISRSLVERWSLN